MLIRWKKMITDVWAISIAKIQERFDGLIWLNLERSQKHGEKKWYSNAKKIDHLSMEHVLNQFRQLITKIQYNVDGISYSQANIFKKQNWKKWQKLGLNFINLPLMKKTKIDKVVKVSEVFRNFHRDVYKGVNVP